MTVARASDAWGKGSSVNGYASPAPAGKSVAANATISARKDDTISLMFAGERLLIATNG